MNSLSEEKLKHQNSGNSSKSPGTLMNPRNSSKPEVNARKSSSTSTMNMKHSSRSTLSTKQSSRSTYTAVSEIATEKGLVCVQLVVLARLCFDLASAIIGFLKHRRSVSTVNHFVIVEDRGVVSLCC